MKINKYQDNIFARVSCGEAGSQTTQLMCITMWMRVALFASSAHFQLSFTPRFFWRPAILLNIVNVMNERDLPLVATDRVWAPWSQRHYFAVVPAIPVISNLSPGGVQATRAGNFRIQITCQFWHALQNPIGLSPCRRHLWCRHLLMMPPFI